MSSLSLRKITVSLPSPLVEFADFLAKQSNTSRSQVIRQALGALKAREEERLAAQGYRFYATEATEFAAASARATAEAINVS